MTEVSDLPSGWARVPLGEITVEVGQVDPAQVFDNEFTYLDISSVDNQHNRIVEPRGLAVGEAPSRARQRVMAGDVLLSTVRTYLKNTAYVEARFDGQIASTGFCVLRAAPGVEPRYLYHFVLTRDFVQSLSAFQRGVSYPAVRDSDVRGQSIPLAPSNEQRRIVEKIDELFSDIEEGERALEWARTLLDRYRQAVLKAAVSGELTKNWREKHKGEIESGEALLARILKARREAWEQTELAKMRAKGEEPTDERWKDRYKEAITANTEHHALPPEWTWASIDQLTSSFTNGLSRKPEDEAPGTPILRISAVRALSVDSSEHRFYRPSLGERVELYFLRHGDVLFTRYNGSPHLVGVCGVIVSDEPMLFPDKLMRARIVADELISPEYLALCANVGVSRRYIERRVKTSAGQHGISGAEVRSAPIPLASSQEQAVIVERVRTLLSGLEAIEAELDTRAKAARSLRQSILTAAFSGKLARQDPSDEPASALLDRIRAERASTGKPPVKRRGRQPGNTRKTVPESALPVP